MKKTAHKEPPHTMLELSDAMNQAEAFISLLMDYIIRFDHGESHVFREGAAAGLMQIEWNTVGRLNKAAESTCEEIKALRGILKGES